LFSRRGFFALSRIVVAQLPLQVRHTILQDGDQLPSVFARIAQQIDLIGPARRLIERDLLVFPSPHRSLLPTRHSLLAGFLGLLPSFATSPSLSAARRCLH